jgi:hypothetical protein
LTSHPPIMLQATRLPIRAATSSTMSSQLVAVAPEAANSQPTVAGDHKENAPQPRDPVKAVFNTVGSDSLVSIKMFWAILTHLSTNCLS